MTRAKKEEIAEIYGIDLWGGGYVDIDEDGDLLVKPRGSKASGKNAIKITGLVDEWVSRGHATPLLIRFPQILGHRIHSLSHAFDSAISEFEYGGTYTPVFPIKVNQTSTVLENLVREGRKHGMGIEVGSKAELLLALSMDLVPGAPIVCNGFKDKVYYETMALGLALGHRIISVIEKPFELTEIFNLYERHGQVPELGIRVRLNARGSGLWEKSGGSASKFGLSTSQLISTINRLRDKGILDRLTMFHFHIGSQITEIRRVKDAIKECARIYAKTVRLGVKIGTIDVGGGLGIDYDGSRTSSDASMNYTMNEYANDVVYTLAEVCRDENVDHPNIISESGRALTAYHSLLVVDVMDQIGQGAFEPFEVKGDHGPVIAEMEEILGGLTVKNYREYYHDAVEKRDEARSLFNLGMLSLHARAQAEYLFWEIAKKALLHARTAKYMSEEFQDLQERLVEKLVVNFSVFQSLPDHWALGQLFPVVPIHRLNEKPTQKSTIVDITCDSDGEVDKFVDLKDIKDALEVHSINESSSYHLAFMLMGAYQDTMGDLHNLFGRVHEMSVVQDDNGHIIWKDVRMGQNVSEVVKEFGYDPEVMLSSIEQKVDHQAGQTFSSQYSCKDDVLKAYKELLLAYPYLT